MQTRASLELLLAEGEDENSYDTKTHCLTVHGHVYGCGATKRLMRLFYRNHKPISARRHRHGSSRLQGDRLHRHIYHYRKCGRAQCSCKRKFGVRTATALPHSKSPTQRQVRMLCGFLRKQHLALLDCETIVGWKDAKAATMLDAVCYDTRSNVVYVLEFKTGYQDRFIPSTLDPLHDRCCMQGKAGVQLLCTDYNKHHLQLWFGMRAFEETYGLSPADGLLIYFDRTRTGGFCLQIHRHSRWAKSISTTLPHIEEQLLA